MKKTIIKVVALALLAVMVCSLFVSCGGPASDPDKAEKALKDAGYLATNITTKLGYDGCTNIVSGAKISTGDFISIYYFDKKASADDAWEKIEENAKKENEKESEFVCKKSGKVIYFGTKQAVKDAK